VILLILPDQSPPPPPDSREPRPCLRHRRRRGRNLHSPPPPLEPRPRREIIHAPSVGGGGGGVLPMIQQNISNRIPHLARRHQLPRVIPIPPNRPLRPESAIDRLRNANRHSLNTSRQRGAVFSLDNQMDMIPLHRKVQHAKLLRR